MDEVNIPKYFIRHAVDYVGCHENTVNSYIKQGYVTPVRDRNGFRRFTKTELKKLRKIYRINNPD